MALVVPRTSNALVGTALRACVSRAHRATRLARPTETACGTGAAAAPGLQGGAGGTGLASAVADQNQAGAAG